MVQVTLKTKSMNLLTETSLGTREHIDLGFTGVAHLSVLDTSPRMAFVLWFEQGLDKLDATM
jgi:hypothetical protein